MAEQTTFNTTTDLSVEMKTFYDKRLLDRLLPNLGLLKHGQKRPIPKNGGKTIEFRKFNSLAPATTALTEGVPPTPTKLSVSKINARVDQYGDYVEVTDVLDATAIDPVISETVELQGEQAAETIERVVKDILMDTPSVYNVGGGLDEDEIEETDHITGNDILNLQTILKRSNIKPFGDGYYKGYFAPEQLADLMRDELWRDVSTYNNSGKNIEDGEIGRFRQFKFIDSTLVEPVENTAGVNVYSGLAIGRDAYGIVDIENGSKPKSIIKLAKDDSSDVGNPLNQISTIGWKAFFTAVRLNDLALIRVNSSATDVSGAVIQRVTGSAGSVPAGGGAEMIANQAAIQSVNAYSNTITVNVDVDSLSDYTSSDPVQAQKGDVNWLGLLIHTNAEDITQLKYNGSSLSAADVAEATACGGEAGDIILWIVADTVKTTPKIFTLSGDNYKTTEVTVEINDLGE